MHTPALSIALALALLPAAVMADCPPEGEIVSCRIGGKALEVCHRGDAMVYSFGPAGQPDLTIAAPLDTIAYTPWPGIGNAIWDSVTFENQGYFYEVWTSIERNPEVEAELQGGINVLSGEALQAQLVCDPGSLQGNVDRISEAKQKIGQCWDFDSRKWVNGTCQ